MEISSIVESVFSLFIMILVGIYGNKRKIISPEINKGLTDILIEIALPIMIVTSFIFTYDDTIKSNVISTFYYSLIAYIIIIIISPLILSPVDKDKKTILHFANVFTNTGYIGFPILHSIYGHEGVIYGSIFNMFFVIFLWTYGLILFNGSIEKKNIKEDIKKLLLNPSIIAVFIGIVIMVFNIQLPRSLLASMKAIGNTTGPLSMIIIGGIISKTNIKKHIKDWTLYYGIFVKLMVIPVIIYLVSLFFGISSKPINTVVIMTAMPASAMTSILAEKFNKEKEYAAILVSVTTLLSLITVPILLKIIM